MAEETRNIEVKTEKEGAVVSSLPNSLSDSYRDRLGKLIELTERQKKLLKAWLKEKLNEWESDTADLHQNLMYDNDLVEGVIYDTDYPWEGAFNTHVPITETYMDIFRSIEKRSILGADRIWYAETGEMPIEAQELVADVEEMLNYKSRKEWNIEKCLKEVFWITNRDGLGAMCITWEEEYKKKTDVILLTSQEDFLKEFPSPEDAGLTEEEWFELGATVQSEASEEFPVEVPITFEQRTYYGCKGEAIDLVNFVTIPANVPSIHHELCRGYGKRYITRSESIRKGIREGRYYEDEARAVLKDGGEYTESDFKRSQDEIEGLKRTNKKGEYQIFELAIIGRLNGDGDEEADERYDDEMCFLVVYNKEKDKLLSCIEYPYRVPYYATFRIDSRPNRLIGNSIPRKTRDINEEMDYQHNQRVNSRTIGTVPVFKALLSKKAEVDGALKEQKFKPGRVFWLSDFNSFDQFKIQPVDLGESMSEEKNDQQILDLRLGASASLLSGGPATGDPDAPGNKTAMMIAQSNLRMDDPLDELREGVEEVGNICLSHLYQFGTPIISFGEGERIKTLHKKYLRQGLKMKMSGVSVILNPEFEMQKSIQTHQLLMSEPLYASNAKLRVEGLRTALRAGRIQNREAMLPKPEVIEQMETDLRKKALAQMEMEKQAAEAQKRQEEVEGRLKQAKRELDVRNTARRLAESNLSLNGVGNGANGVSNGFDSGPQG